MKIKVNKKIKESSSVGAGGISGFSGGIKNVGSHKKEKKDMREEETEKLMREYIRKKIKKYLWEQEKQKEQYEYQLRTIIRGVIKEAKEQANPHPNTGINKLRDAFRKAKPTLKTKYQQLTSSKEQRETFTAHILRAFVRLFDELDALQAKGDVETDVEDIETAVGEAPDLGLESPPAGEDEENIDDDIEGLLESILKEVEVDIKKDDEMDIVSDDEKNEEEKNKSRVEKDFDKKKESDKEKEQFGAGMDGDTTGRNQAFDTFRLVQTYFSDAYLDLADEEDQKMYRDWCLYNMKLLFQNFEEALPQSPGEPEIKNPEGA